MSSRSNDYDPLEPLADEFVQRYRQGENPTIAEYADQYPDFAERIRALFPTLVMMEELAPQFDPFDKLAARDDDSSLVPRQYGDYRVLREIGRGGMGIVCEAEQISLERKVALKVLTGRHSRSDESLERFRREARAAGRLHHPNIVPVFEVGQVDDTYFYTMQLIQGQGLDRILEQLQRLRLSRHGTFTSSTESRSATATVIRQRVRATITEPLATHQVANGSDRDTMAENRRHADGETTATPISTISEGGQRRYFRRVAEIGRQVAESMAFAHQQGILHRDIKPSNLLLDASGHVWVTDFGLAKETFSSSPNLTHTGDVVGTIRYMAPERFRGWSDPRSDVYSLGITLYEMLTLQPAHHDNDRLALMEKVRNNEPRKPTAIDSQIPRDLETIVLKSIHKEPGLRYQTASEMADDLRNFLADRPIHARRASLTERTRQWCRRNPAMAGMLTVVVLLLTVIAVGMSLMSWRLSRELGTSEVLRRQAERAERERTVQLRQSLLDQARATRQSGQPGARIESLAALRQAAMIQPGMDLRNEATAAMALIEIDPTPVWTLPFQGRVAIFDRNLERLLTQHSDKQVIIRDRTGKTVHRFGSLELVDGMFSPDGQFVVIKDFSETNSPFVERLRIFDLQSERELLQVVGEFQGMVFDFHPDGSEMVIAHPDQQIVFYRLPDLAPIREFPVPASGGLHVRYNPTGNYLAMVSIDEQFMAIVDARTGETIKNKYPSGPRFHGIIDFNADGALLGVASNDWRAYIFDVAAEKIATTLVGHDAEVTHVEFIPNSQLVVTSSWDNTIRLWNLTDGQQVMNCPGQLRRLSADGRQLAFQDGNVTGVRNITASREIHTMHGHGQVGPTSVRFSPDGRLLLSPGFGELVVWNVAEGTRLATIKDHVGLIAMFTPSGDALVTATNKAIIRRSVKYSHNSVEIGPATVIPMEETVERRAALVPNGSVIIATNDLQEKLEIVSIHGDRIGEIPCKHPNEVTVSPDGKWVCASAWAMKWIAIFELETRRLVKHVRFRQFPVRAFSPDSRRLVWCTTDTCEVLSTTTWQRLAELPRELVGSRVASLAFHPDGSILAVAKDDGTILLLDGDEYFELAHLRLPVYRAPNDLVFSPDGRYLAMRTNGGPSLFDLHLIRSGLREMNLDWDPPCPPLQETDTVDVKVVIRTGT